MNGAGWNKLNRRQQVLAGLAVVLAVLLALSLVDFKFEDWPLPGNLRSAETTLKGLRRELATLEKEQQARERSMERLRQQARPVWTKVGKVPTVEVQAELEKVARIAKVTIQNVGAPRTTKIADNLSGVELTLRIIAPMRDISRFLLEVEKNQPPFFWATCTLRPDNPREPRAVTLDGQIRAYVLSPEAIKFLTGSKAGGTP